MRSQRDANCRHLDTVGTVLVTGLVLLASVGCNRASDGIPATNVEEADLALLKIGELLPEVESAGWLNGPPPQIGSDPEQVSVLDLWADS